MSLNQIFNFKKIDTLISTAGLLNENQLSLLKSENYEAVVNLLPEEIEYAVKNESSIVEGQGLIYQYIPVDFSAPTQEDYQAFEQALLALSGKKVMLHCAANYRVSAFYAIFAHSHLGWSTSKAYEHISSIWSLEEHPVWEAFVQKMLAQ